MPTISPFLICYDGGPGMDYATPGSPYEPRIQGPDARLRVLGNDPNLRRNGGYRQYGFANTLWDATAAEQWRATHEYYFRRSLKNLWWGGSTTAERYNITAYQNMAAGVYDDRFRNLVYSLPIGTSGPGPKRPPWTERWHEFRFPVMHEPDIYTDMQLPEHVSDPNAVKDAYRAGMRHVLRVMVEAAIEKGAHPAEFAAGGLLAASDTPSASDWRWWVGMPADLKASKFIAQFWDEYFNFNSDGSPQSFRTRVNTRVAEFRAEGGWGILRPILGETAIDWRSAADLNIVTGNNAGMIAWLAEIEEWITNGPGESVAIFHGAPGNSSFFADGRVPSAEQLAYAMKRINIDQRPPLDAYNTSSTIIGYERTDAGLLIPLSGAVQVN